MVALLRNGIGSSCPAMPPVLIVAYGNPLRSDDGVAWRAADLLSQKLHVPDAEILHLHQLTPELADTLRHVGCVIFIDAVSSQDCKGNVGNVHVEEIDARAQNPARFSHALSPQKVLGLAAELYGARPRAFAVTVTGASFDHGDSLSPAVANSLIELVAAVERLAKDAASKA